MWNATDASGSSWSIDSSPFAGHTNSVEDVQWSPTEATVFISASSDKTCRVWDIRGKKGPQITFQAHQSDVNVISWNQSVNYLLASGSDDGSFKVSAAVNKIIGHGLHNIIYSRYDSIYDYIICNGVLILAFLIVFYVDMK